jgi:F-type H+-transporting ATPase subunit delta
MAFLCCNAVAVGSKLPRLLQQRKSLMNFSFLNRSTPGIFRLDTLAPIPKPNIFDSNVDKRWSSSKKFRSTPENIMHRFNPNRSKENELFKPKLKLYTESGCYAHVLFGATVENKTLDQTYKEVTNLIERCENTPSLRSIFNERVDFKAKEAGLIEILEEMNIKTVLKDFLVFLYREERLSKALEMFSDFIALWKSHMNVLDAVVTTAVALNDREVSAFNDYIRERYIQKGMNLQLQTAVDSSILGGFVIELGPTTVDFSISGEMENIQKRLDDYFRRLNASVSSQNPSL